VFSVLGLYDEKVAICGLIVWTVYTTRVRSYSTTGPLVLNNEMYEVSVHLDACILPINFVLMVLWQVLPCYCLHNLDLCK